MKKKGFYKNIILGVIVAVVALALFINRTKSDIGASLSDNNQTDVPNSEQTNTIDTENVDIDLSLIEVNEEFLNSMDEKELLHYKVINSIDFFDTVEGEVVRFGAHFNDTSKYIIDVKNNKSLIRQESSEYNIESIFNNYSSIELNNSDNTYRNMRVSVPDEEKISDLKKLKPKQRYSNDVLLSRRTELLGGVAESILSEEFLGQYLQDHDKWTIDGNEEFIGRQCTKISGKRNVVDSRTKAESYTALIDTETGIVLKYDEMDSQGNIVDGLETKNIKFNEEYDSKLFELSTEGYTEKVF